jgi:CitB family two-component system response regulator CitT
MRKALIVEDDYRIGMLHEKYLENINGIESAGHALNAKEMWELLKERQADVLLLDIYLPDSMGIHLLEDLRHFYPGTDIIIITAATDREYLEKSLRGGIVNYLIKPVTIEKFEQTLKDYLSKRDSMDAVQNVNQQFIDDYLSQPVESKPAADKRKLPTGIDYLTLESVEKVLREAHGGLTAEQAANKIGASRTTARRYLEFMISEGEAEARLEYGIVGRPERHYYEI